ncbi:MAG: hypothetical protein CM15mP74_17950 [Halieaceae bacterium]|nr:MAG: hypothetical protein CM15mP74_17950 [Halieaceae bacterium]
MPGCWGLMPCGNWSDFSGLARQPGAWSGIGLGRGEIHRANSAQSLPGAIPHSDETGYERKLVMGIADGSVSVDGDVIYTASDLRVGLFQNTGSM